MRQGEALNKAKCVTPLCLKIICKANFQTKKKSLLFFITAAMRQSKPPRLPLGGNSARKAPWGEGYIKGKSKFFVEEVAPLIRLLRSHQAAEIAFERQLGEKSPPGGRLYIKSKN